jgi:cysteinyl-tRNA synthetase
VVVVIFPDSGERYLSTSLFSVKHKVMLHLVDSLTGKKQRFEPVKPDSVAIYTCGPTVYHRLNPGSFRRFVFTDLLVRYLAFHGVDVHHVINITDYDDRTIGGAGRAGQDLEAFTQPYIRAFYQDLARLKIRPAQAYPRVSAHFSDMADLTRKLLDKGYAYEKLHSVYFDISKVAEYGHLSKMDIQKIRVGATVDLDEYEKLNPRDFTLFKRVRLSELRRGIGVKTEWGQVRPSLHLQCATLSMLHLGVPFDVHTGSRELVFPHHENERAIARAVEDRELANVWLHCDPVRYDGSLGPGSITDLTLDTLADLGWDDGTIRFWLLSGHYRRSLTLSERSLADARATRSRINRCIALLERIRSDGTGSDALPGKGDADIDQLMYDIRQGVLTALADDLKISAALAALLAGIKAINTRISRQGIHAGDADRILTGLQEMDRIFQVCEFNRETSQSPQVKDLLRQRRAAREQRDWALADRLRDRLTAMGVPVHDQKVETD